MKKYLKIIFWCLLVILTTLYLYCFIPLVLDGVWNYGFGYNITQGLVPYRDFNMIIPPLFPYILSLFINITGNKFIIYYIVISIIIVLITVISYKKIGYKSILIYFIILIYPHNGYNTFALFLLFILLFVIDKDNNKDNNNDILIAVIISLMFLTKQTLGLLIIPSIIYSKNKKKTICIYFIAILLLLIYLLFNNNLYEFIDYCFLGMFDFTNKNTTEINLVLFIEIPLVIYLFVLLIKSKFKNKEIFYILLFQIISFPITDGSHFILTLSPIIYYFYSKYRNKYFVFIFTVMLVFYILGFNVSLYNPGTDIIYKDKSSFLNYKKVPNYFNQYFDFINNYSKQYKDYRLYLLDSRAYVGKLEYNMKIDKFDLINDGNMGYNGCYKYVNEIHDYCSEHKCLFIVNKEEALNDINQTNKYIVSYVMYNYIEIASSNVDSIYIN